MKTAVFLFLASLSLMSFTSNDENLETTTEYDHEICSSRVCITSGGFTTCSEWKRVPCEGQLEQ